MIDETKLGGTLLRLRTNAKLSQQQAIRGIKRINGHEISSSALSQYELGRVSPKISTVYAMCEYYFPENPIAGVAWVLSQAVKQ